LTSNPTGFALVGFLFLVFLSFWALFAFSLLVTSSIEGILLISTDSISGPFSKAAATDSFFSFLASSVLLVTTDVFVAI